MAAAAERNATVATDRLGQTAQAWSDDEEAVQPHQAAVVPLQAKRDKFEPKKKSFAPEPKKKSFAPKPNKKRSSDFGGGDDSDDDYGSFDDEGFDDYGSRRGKKFAGGGGGVGGGCGGSGSGASLGPSGSAFPLVSSSSDSLSESESLTWGVCGDWILWGLLDFGGFIGLAWLAPLLAWLDSVLDSDWTTG